MGATANEDTAQSPESAVEAPAETNAESGDGENVEPDRSAGNRL